MNSETPEVIINDQSNNIESVVDNQEQKQDIQEETKLVDEVVKPKIRFVIAGNGNFRNSASYLEVAKRGVDLNKVYSQPVVVEEKPKNQYYTKNYDSKKQYTKNYDSKKTYDSKKPYTKNYDSKKQYNTEKKPYYNKNKENQTTKTE
jgi:hypothetical protein